MIRRLGRDLRIQVDVGGALDKYNRPIPAWVAATPPTVRGVVQEGARTEVQTPAGLRVIATHEIYTTYAEALLGFEKLRIVDGITIYDIAAVEDEVGMRDHLLIRATFGGYLRDE